MKNQFRVISWTKDVSKYSESKTAELEDGRVVTIEPTPLEGTTTFMIELSQVDMNDVNQILGTTYVTLDYITEYTGEAKLDIEQKLAVAGLYEEGDADPLERAKQLRWGRIVAIRDGLESKGFEYLGKLFDSDQRSTLRIFAAVQGATSAALAGLDFSIDWTTADNSVVTLTRDQVLGIPAAMAVNANAIHEYARTLKSQLNSAGSIEDVQAVQWVGVESEIELAYNPFDENGDLQPLK